MRVPAEVLKEVRFEAHRAVQDGELPARAWLAAMILMKCRYQKARNIALAYGFSK